MRSLATAVGVLMFAASTLTAEVVTPVSALATSEFGEVDVFGDGNFSDVFVTDLIDGGGLMDVDNTPDNVLDDSHDNDASSLNGWHSGDFDAGIPGGLDNGDTNDGDPGTAPPVDAQIVEFDLGGSFEITKAHIWQQNQGGVFGDPLSPDRGVDEFEILVSPDPEGDTFTSAGIYNLDFEEGIEPVFAQVIELNAAAVARRIRFDINSAHSQLDNEFVGLSEVRFEGTAQASGCDVNGDGVCDATDIDEMSQMVIDGTATDQQRLALIESPAPDGFNTYVGDSDLNGVFDEQDIVLTFTEGKYLTGERAGWAEGDWDGNLIYDEQDFVASFAAGGYLMSPRGAVAAVPEPTSLVSILLGVVALSWASRRRRTPIA